MKVRLVMRLPANEIHHSIHVGVHVAPVAELSACLRLVLEDERADTLISKAPVANSPSRANEAARCRLQSSSAAVRGVPRSSSNVRAGSRGTSEISEGSD